jgi:selenocysteine lyase/cysteine desulfurase
MEIIDNDASGQVSLKDLERRIGGDIKLVAVTHVPTRGVWSTRRRRSARLRAPAGQMPLDVRELDCDMLTATGRNT